MSDMSTKTPVVVTTLEGNASTEPIDTVADMLEAIRIYDAQGWTMTPVLGKKPFRDGWQLEGLGLEAVTSIVSDMNCNVGVVLGEPSEWLVDIDLDHPLAVELGDQFIPTTTCIFGRPGKPRSHRLFYVTAPVTTKQYRLPDKQMIVELRSTGGQTVFPPSVHESGEPIAWDAFGEPSRIEPGELVTAVTKLAAAVEQRLGIERKNRKSDRQSPPPDRMAIVERCRRYVERMAPAISGQGGHNATFKVACELFRFGLTDTEARQLLDEYNAICQPPWSDRELAHKLADAHDRVIRDDEFGWHLRKERAIQYGQPEQQSGVDPHNHPRLGSDSVFDVRPIRSGRLENANVVADIDGHRQVIPVPMQAIIATIREFTGGFPKRVDRALFVEDAHGIAWLESTQALFGWLQSTIGLVDWRSGHNLVRQSEVFEELRRTSERFAAVETLPHEPAIDTHYYAGERVELGDGEALRWLLSRFEPASDLDGDLIKAAFLTPMWGGPPGCRPCFLITSDDGRGAGKSTLAEMVGLVFGGVLSFSHLEDVGTIKTRLLSPEALPRRVALLDNVKSNKFSWADLEAMITSTSIGGHRMYVGEAVRPNTLVWFVTVNGAALSTDLAQRSVIIKIRRPARTATWLEDTRLFVEQHRREILGDIIAALRVEPSALNRFSRWATWERDVLQRLPEPVDAQRLIEERQSAVDVDGEEAVTIEDGFASELKRLNYDPDTQRVFLPSMIVWNWFVKTTGERVNKITANRVIRQMIDEGRVRRLVESKSRSVAGGRGLVWEGAESTLLTPLSVDIEDRIGERSAFR